jgi:hypothetical protein
VATRADTEPSSPLQRTASISFAEPPRRDEVDKALHIPPPPERDQDRDIEEVDYEGSDVILDRAQTNDSQSTISGKIRQRRGGQQAQRLSSMSISRVAETLFTLGPSSSRSRQETVARPPQELQLSQQLALPELSSQATVGRNSQFRNLTAEDRELLGGIEYRAMKLLLKIVTAYFFGLHLFGVICLVPWIRNTDPKYRDYLQECGQNSVWWWAYNVSSYRCFVERVC